MDIEYDSNDEDNHQEMNIWDEERRTKEAIWREEQQIESINFDENDNILNDHKQEFDSNKTNPTQQVERTIVVENIKSSR